ncbi:MAG: DUF6290 family protein [Lacrimispora sp.]|uniref:DUF6290 family protein n=1 Tax=Lacrimispora sp. TaxID=2719234 RepID=UPI0039E426BD
MEMKTVSVKLTEKEIRLLDELATQANMNRSDYIRRNIFNQSVQVIDKSNQFYKSILEIHEAVVRAEQCNNKVSLDEIREKVMKACFLLRE